MLLLAGMGTTSDSTSVVVQRISDSLNRCSAFPARSKERTKGYHPARCSAREPWIVHRATGAIPVRSGADRRSGLAVDRSPSGGSQTRGAAERRLALHSSSAGGILAARNLMTAAVVIICLAAPFVSGLAFTPIAEWAAAVAGRARRHDASPGECGGIQVLISHGAHLQPAEGAALRWLPERWLGVLKARHYLKMLKNFDVDDEPDMKIVRAAGGDSGRPWRQRRRVYEVASELVGQSGRVLSVEPVPQTFGRSFVKMFVVSDCTTSYCRRRRVGPLAPRRCLCRNIRPAVSPL